MSETTNDNTDVSVGVLDHNHEDLGADAVAEIARLKAQLAEAQAKNDVTDDDDDDVPQLAVEREVRKGYQKGELCGNTVLVPPLQQWKSSAMRALNAGDFETWAERTLDDDGWEVWQDCDPSLDEIDAFFGTFDLGVGRGNSRGSRRSSRNTRTR